VLNEEKQPQKPIVPVMTAAEQAEAMRFLKQPDLMDQIIEDLEPSATSARKTASCWAA
jgi:hypothetical protein